MIFKNMDTEIDLGFAEERDNAAWLTNRYFPSKLGGRPAWLELESLPTTQELQCNRCHTPRSFLCQLYAPFDDDFNFHRSIYVFICRSEDCQQSNNADNICVLRSQLGLKNKFYSEHEPADSGQPLPPVPCLKKLCAACGCPAPHTCSRCKSINYCSAAHQRAHWPQHKPHCGSATCVAPKPLGAVQFPEYEIVMEVSTTNTKRTEEQEEDVEHEQARLLEFEELAATGKTGELSNMPEAELDKYFGDDTAVDDKTFRNFKKQTAAEPEQIVRYKRGGKPLWIADVTTTVDSQLQTLPSCSHCGGPRQFEFQIMPQILVLLKDECIDWGVVAVYTCARSCDISGYVVEHVVKQDIITEQPT